MKKRINLQFNIVAAAAILSTLLLASFIYYNLFNEEVKSELKLYAELLISTEIIPSDVITHNNSQDTGFSEDGTVVSDSADYFEKAYKLTSVLNMVKPEDGIRFTIILPDGEVLYDTAANINTMENHLKRPEIEEALKYGTGSDIRISSTLDKNTFYYAVLMENGMLLRVSKDADNMLTLIKSAFPLVILIAVLLFILCMIISHAMTSSIVRPVEQLANGMENDSLEKINTYDELSPLITMIQSQHEDIVKNSRMRQEFTANVSHELKTPLASISGYSELIENGMAKGEEAARFAGEIHKNSKRLLNLINDILRLSQLDSSQMEVSFEDVDIFAVAQNTVNLLKFNADSSMVSIEAEGEEAHIMANKGMIEELLYNLCDNAIRYNNPGGYVRVSVLKEEGRTIVTVADNGIGISKEHQDRIFERFYRVDKSRSKATGGTGLGLAIVKHIVIKHNAMMELESEEGKGTKIKITFC